jgi:predicted GTPase
MEFSPAAATPVAKSNDDRQFVINSIQNLKYLDSVSKTLDLPTQDIKHALARLENRDLSVVVVGEFKRGKSTFINALLGRDLLPSDILPTTATINRIRFGATPSATVRFKDGSSISISLDELATYVTKLTSAAETISNRVQEASIYYPLHYCQNGVEIIDTPGLSDDDSMTEITLSVLNRTEIAIMVTSAISPFAESEGVFLTDVLLTRGIDRILFVVNGIDNFKRSEDIDRVIQNITQRIKQHIQDWANRQFGAGTPAANAYMQRMGNPHIFGLSAQQALQAKLNQDTALLERSRFQEFEISLNRLLTEERQQISLQMSVETANFAAHQILKTIHRQQHLLIVQQQLMTKKILSIIENIDMLRSQSREELDGLDREIIQSASQVTTVSHSLNYRLKQASEQIIDNTSVNMSSNLNGIVTHFADRVASAFREVISTVESELTKVANQEIDQRSLDLKNIANAIDRQIDRIQNLCSQIEVDLNIKSSIVRHYNAHLPTIVYRLSNLCAVDSSLFFIQEPAKGGYTATGAAIGALFGGVGLPVGAAIGAGLGEQRRKQKFKQFYKPEVLSAIETKLNSEHVDLTVNRYVVTATSNLTTSARIVGEQTEIVIDEIEQSFATFRGRRAAEDLATQTKLEQLRSEIQKVFDDTQQLLGHLH